MAIPFGGRAIGAPKRGLNRISTGGLRNEIPLTQAQKAKVTSYANSLGVTDNMIIFSENMNTGYANLFGKETLYVGTDVYPATKSGLAANSYVTMKGTIAHEIVGHRAASLAGKTQASGILEEAQASIRAARFAPELSTSERITLLRDGLTRFRNKMPLKEVKNQYWIQPV